MKGWRLAAVVLLAGCKKEPAPPPPVPASTAAALSVAKAAEPAPGNSLAILKDFEGQIAWKVSGKLAGPGKEPKPIELALLAKGDKFRLDLPQGMPGAPGTGSAYLVGHPGQKKFFIVIDAQKQAISIDPERLAAQAGAMDGKSAAPGAGGDAPKLEKTGRQDKVAGYACEVWQLTHKTSKTELCVAAESVSWFNLPVSKLPPEQAWASELIDGKHFPLRFTTFDKSGAEEGRVELASIDKKPIEAAKLEVPAGYQLVDLEAMMNAMMKGLAGVPGLAGARGAPGTPDFARALPSGVVLPKRPEQK